jgi:hypothetical protein
MHHGCGLGPTVLAVFVIVALPALLLAMLVVALVRAHRRRGPGEPVDLGIAEQLARRVLARGTLELAIGTWGIVIATGLEHMGFAALLGIVAVVGATEHASARRALALLDNPGAVSELRRATLMIATPLRTVWLGASRDAVARAQANATPTARAVT